MHHEDDQDIQAKISLATWKKIIKIVFTSKKNVFLLLMFVTIVALFDVAWPLMNRYAIDVFFFGNDYSTWPIFVTVLLVFSLLFGLSIWGFIRQAGIIQANTSYYLRKEAFENLQRLSHAYFDQTPHGWIMARMTSDARKLSMIISWGLLDFIWAGFQMVAILIVLYITFVPLALIITILLPIMLVIAFYFQKAILKRHREAKKHNSQLTAQFNEGFTGAKTTKSLSIEQQNYQEFEVTAKKLKKASVRAALMSAAFSSVILVLAYIGVATTMFQGSRYVLMGSVVTIGILQMFISYTINFFEPVMVITQIFSDFQNAQASAERIVGLIETKPEIIDRPDVIEKYGDLLNDRIDQWEPLKGDIEFKDVTFYYLDNEIILDHFNLKVKAGQSVALVGHTGSGKSTIVNLLSRFYEPKKGEILIDGIDYRNRSLHWLHKRLGYVLQSPHLFSTTIMENIRYGRLDATDEEVIQAAQMVGVSDFVEKLEKGYETFVGEGGNLLSVGQKQLISFARAVLANPRILILDEATSSIDSETEVVIQEATEKLLKDRTSFIVAHRLSTIVHADVIIMLDMGKIIEMGSHDELIEKRGHYYELYKNQFLKERLANVIQ